MSYTDTETGEPIEGKAYILKSTDGEEITDPKRLFAAETDQAGITALQQAVSDLQARVEQLEAAATTNPAETTPGA